MSPESIYTCVRDSILAHLRLNSSALMTESMWLSDRFEAHLWRGWGAWGEGRWTEAEVTFRESLSCSEQIICSWYAGHHSGSFNERSDKVPTSAFSNSNYTPVTSKILLLLLSSAIRPESVFKRMDMETQREKVNEILNFYLMIPTHSHHENDKTI